MAENDILTPVTRKELFYEQIIENAGGGGGGGSTTIVPLSVDHNATFTAPEGTAYSPVTVNVPTTGDYTTYVKSASSVGGIQFSADELSILKGAFCSMTIGQIATAGRLSEDNPTLYVIAGIGGWLITVFYFGYFSITTSTGSITQEVYSWTIGSSSAPSSYTLSGSTTITFYVTSAQKQALDAL